MFRFFKYQLPFRIPFKTGNRTFYEREGIMLLAECNGVTAFGEAAPLPGFAETTADDIEILLTAEKEEIERRLTDGNTQSYLKTIAEKYNVPALSFGLNMLFADYEAKKNNIGLFSQLGGKNIFNVPCNAVLGIHNPQETDARAKELLEDGFDTLKIKIGADFTAGFEAVKSVRRQFPAVKLRLDANQAWSVGEAIRNLNELAAFGIEYCEQPVAKDDIDGLANVRKKSKIKIAADESLTDHAAAEQLIRKQAADIFIIKPMQYGNFTEIFVTKTLADSHGIETVFTSSLELLPGRRATAILAALWGSKKYAHGLATGSFLRLPADGSTEEIINGHYILNDEAGLGIHLNENSLAVPK